MTASISNYTIGKGIVSFKPSGTGGAYTDLGNAPAFQFTPKIETLDHYSSRQGIKILDNKVVLSKSGELKVTLEEITLANLALFMLDDAFTSGGTSVNILKGNAVNGAFKIVGTNDVGPKWTYEFLNCSIIPASGIDLIGDTWAKIELTANVLLDTASGAFGTITASAP